MPSRSRFPPPRKRALAAALAGLLLVPGLALLPTASAGAPYQPPELKDSAVQAATLAIAQKYANAVPGVDAKTLRWFLYVIVHKESWFNKHHCNYNDGAERWNEPKSWFWPTKDHLPHGCGLTQLTGWWHEGIPYPNNQGSAPSTLWKGDYGYVTPPRAVSKLDNPFDPTQNLERFVTEHVLPEFVVIKRKYPHFSTDETLRAVAYHWNKGDFTHYDASDCSYLCSYDKYVRIYKPAVLNDPNWPSGGSGSGGSTPTATWTLSPNVNAWWAEIYIKSSTGGTTAMSVSVNGGAPVALHHTSWGSWATSTKVPSGASVVFTATTSGHTLKSPTYRWP